MTVLSSPPTTLYPARAGSRTLTAEDMWRIPRVGAPTPSPDGKTVAVPVTTYDLETNKARTRIWLCATAGGDPRALTSAEASSSEPRFSPDGKQLAFVRKSDDAQAQLYVMPLDGGEGERLTDMPLGVFDPQWLPDGNGLVFASPLVKGHLTPEATKAELERRDKDPVKAQVTEERVYRFWDTWLTTGEVPHLFVVDLATRAIRDLTPDSLAWFDWMEKSGNYDVAPDGGEVAFAGIHFDEPRSLLRSSIFVAPVAGGQVSCITREHPAEDLRPRYSPDGRSIVYGMTHDPNFYADRVRLMRVDRTSGTHTALLDRWELSPGQWEFAADGTLLLGAEDAGRMSLFALDGQGTPRTLVRGGAVTGLAPVADDSVLFLLQSLVQPPEVYAWSAKDAEARRVTRFTEPTLADAAIGEVRETQIEGSEGATIQMFVILPPGHDPSTKRPLVQVIHGGPHAISGDVFHFRWNPHLFAAPGYIVAMVNFQGSTSWGQDFAKRIQGAWGDRPFQDVMLATDALIATGLVDEERMAATGGSYGGYLVSWIAGQTDRFRCLVNHAGVYDTLSQYASDVTQGRSQSFGGEPWSGLDAIDRWNPARFTAGMTTPMLVIHGERDYRVPVTQGLACYGVLKAKGIPARLVYFPDENHWVLKPRNSILWYREVHAWLERWLGA